MESSDWVGNEILKQVNIDNPLLMKVKFREVKSRCRQIVEQYRKIRKD